MPRKHLITHIRSSVSGKTPLTSSLELGEFAFNTNDGKVFIRKSGSFGDKIVDITVADSTTTGSITISGSLTLTGSLNVSGSASFDGDTVAAETIWAYTGSFGRVDLRDTPPDDEGLDTFIVWDSGSGQFKKRTSGGSGTSGTSGTDGDPGLDGTSGTDGTSVVDGADGKDCIAVGVIFVVGYS